MTIRTQLKAGGLNTLNHNEALQVRTALKAGRKALVSNHSEVLQVRTALKAGGTTYQHNEALQVRSAIKAGGRDINHNEKLQRATDGPAVAMRRELLTTSRKEDRLQLLVVRAGLRAGLRARGRGRYSR
jgi:hypothetical protein